MSNEPAKWIPVNPNELPLKQKENILGMELEVFVSPYDVPKAVRGTYSQSTKRFVIEFDYIHKEPTVNVAHEPHVVMVLGKHSRRLYGVEIDVDSLGVKQVSLKVHRLEANEIKKLKDAAIAAIEKQRLAPGLSHALGRDSYELAEKVLDQTATDLFESITP